MISTQKRMALDTTQLESNAYRAVMPSIIALAVAIMLTIVFATLVDMYYLKPIIKIKKSLHRWLMQRIQYNVTIEGDSEMSKLNEFIKELIMMSKNRKSE
jgi:signal transduction histidine kinase